MVVVLLSLPNMEDSFFIVSSVILSFAGNRTLSLMSCFVLTIP